MSQNIAILIGNTKYDELSTLNCCANDGFEEVFLYFSGHGLSNSDDFFMCFSNFKESSPNTTGLSRNDAFELIRQFKAELSVVVIDACEAGRNLIKKNVTPLSYTLKSKFSNFVQFSSCTESQFSLAGDRISLFTDEFIKACLNKEKGPVYYSDVENALRETFLVVPGSDNQIASPPITEFACAKAAIEEIESLIPSMAKAQEFINGVFEHTVNASGKAPEINDLFDIRTVKYDDFELVQNKSSVIDLLRRRGGSDLFVESDVEKKKRRHPFGMSAALAAFASEDDYDTTYNIWNHSKLQSVHVGIYFEPKSMALNRVFSFSKSNT